MSTSSVILSLFASLPTDEQAETLKSLIDLLTGSSAPTAKRAPAKKVSAVKSSASASVGKAKVSSASSVKREPRAWDREVQAVREEYGVEGDEEGNPLVLSNGEYKYVMSWKDAMVEASVRRREALAMAAAVAAPAPVTKKAVAAVAGAKPLLAKKAVVAEEAELEFFEHEDASYLLASDGAAWHLEDDGSKGAWAGYFMAETTAFDTTRPDPSL